ncbi:MAG: heavy metal translocating P-type ATPase [Eubacterium sp.]|nr:heavy metal translocating P-type ATPase [Eubacterium sp.]
MRFSIKHEMPGRLRVHFSANKMTFREADTLQYYLQEIPEITEVKVYERTADAVVRFCCARERILSILRAFHYEDVDVPESFFDSSSRKVNAWYYEKIVSTVLFRYGRMLFLPSFLQKAWVIVQAGRYIRRALKTIPHKKLEVPVLDAAAVTASILIGDYGTASSVMFLLDVGDLLEDWTHKRSVDDLARRMSLNINQVWLVTDGVETLVDTSSVKKGDQVVIRVGNIIPFDGEVCNGDAMVNQASMTGEAIPVRKDVGKTVFAGTVVEEGEITIRVTKVSGDGRFDKIVHMIEDSEKLKSSVESRAEHLADRLVPATFIGTAITWLFTRNVTKAVSVLMVDFSCAMKLAMPLSVLSAMREAGRYDITVKGGKFLEAVADADILVFDKTGTLTKAQPTVVQVVSFNGEDPDELLRQAACMEEHFPHSIANAVVQAALERGLDHEELHTKVEYIVAHGISTTINDKKAVIGSYHFVFEDEGVELTSDMRDKLDAYPEEYSRLYYAKEDRLAAVILIEDPLRDEAPAVLAELKKLGIRHTVMMTGDSEKTAAAIASRVGVDEYYSEVLPEDKAAYVKKCREEGKKVIMIGDGINDSPALSEADAGIAINEGAEIARMIADITIGAQDLNRLVVLKKISDRLMSRIGSNYRGIVGVNTSIIILGAFGVLSPKVSALLHNSYTVGLGLKSTTSLLEDPGQILS